MCKKIAELKINLAMLFLKVKDHQNATYIPSPTTTGTLSYLKRYKHTDMGNSIMVKNGWGKKLISSLSSPSQCPGRFPPLKGRSETPKDSTIHRFSPPTVAHGTNSQSPLSVAQGSRIHMHHPGHIPCRETNRESFGFHGSRVSLAHTCSKGAPPRPTLGPTNNDLGNQKGLHGALGKKHVGWDPQM